MLRKLWAALKAPAMKAIDKMQATFPVNRLVVLATPAFVSASAWISGWAAKNLPGLPPISSGWIAGIMVAGATAGGVAAYKWIDGWQKHEENIARSADLRFEEHERSKRRARELDRAREAD